MLYSVSSYRSISSDPGIYLFLDQKGNVLYVGKAKNLKKRVSSYFQKNITLGVKTKHLILNTTKVKTIVASSEIEALLLEVNFIKKYQPKYNSKLTDGKAYPLIKITTKDKYPKILVVRKTDNSGSFFFGPYPDTGAMRLVIKTIRRIFPFQSVLNHPNKLCLYYHLGLCPCPPVNNSKELSIEYKKNIKHIVDFLNGEIKKITNDLIAEREKLSREEKFEKANLIQKKIEAIILSTNPVTRTFDNNIDPNLSIDITLNSLNLLSKEFLRRNIKILNLNRIECYDISNISGKFAAGSMVVFTNGKKDPTSYKRFKIRLYAKDSPDDYTMLSEIILRRFNHKEWEYPSLIIVDGGKGQVSIISSLMKELKINIPVIGLAKRNETIITERLEEVKLPKTSPALHLIMRIRDEAHRFALSYHKKLRLKSLQN